MPAFTRALFPRLPWSLTVIALHAAVLSPSVAAQATDYDYFADNRNMIRNGVQAVLTCNGLFTSERTLQQVFDQELAYLGDRRLGDAIGGPYVVHSPAKAVSVGGGKNGTEITAVFREGIGCVVLAPDMHLEDTARLPEITLPYPDRDPAQTPWPVGDLDAVGPIPEELDAASLQAASDWAFDRPTDEQDTISLVVVHKGRIIHERYADGFDRSTRTRTWSTAKSVASTLIGMQADAGELSLDEPVDLAWLPEASGSEDPRAEITLRHLLNMSSGLYPVDSFNMEYATGSGLSYWAGASSVDGARDRGLIREPGTHWDYENYDTLLAVKAFKNTLEDQRSYLQFPRRRLLDPLGMRSTLLSTDRFGDFILSSQVYTNARDLARFGLLYLNNGIWEGKRLISEDWIAFSRTAAPASAERGNDYGGQWWLVPDERKDEVPADAYSTAGNRGQFVIVDPSHDLLIVRRGLDYGKQGFDRWSLLREVLKALP